MKKWVSLLLTMLIFAVPLSGIAQAQERQDVLTSTTIEYLENGDYIITELNHPLYSWQTMANSYTKPGSKTSTYYNSSGTAIWSVTVNGTFTYTYGVSATAASATASVNIYNSNASYVSKSAYTSGNTATATGTVKYNGLSTSKSVSVSCDKYGNLY